MRDLDLEQLRAAADETTPDAVEQAIAHLVNVLVNEYSHTSETASALDVCIGNLRHTHRAERARHAALRSLLPDVRACAEYIVERGVDNADGSARRILTALETQP